MNQLSAFIFITLDGYYKGAGEDISWHKHGMEESEFSEENLKSGNILLFGRKTYEMMASFWPTQQAAEMYPEVAAGMNKSEKIVISNSIKTPSWGPARVIRNDLTNEIKKLKQNANSNITLLGSGNILKQLASEGLINFYQIMVDPVAIGEGTPLFEGIKSPLELKLTSTRTFKDGCVLHEYVPKGK